MPREPPVRARILTVLAAGLSAVGLWRRRRHRASTEALWRDATGSPPDLR